MEWLFVDRLGCLEYAPQESITVLVRNLVLARESV
jgi:hypothetical protein